MMKVLILDTEKHLFVGHQSRWSDNAREAKDFSFTAHARTIAKTLNLKRFQILFYFSDINYHIVVCDSAAETFAAAV